MARNNGLDTPRETRRSLRPNFDPEAFGRLSERFARFLGTARFLVYMTFFVLFWVFWNFTAPIYLLNTDFVLAGFICRPTDPACTKSPSRP